MDKDEVGHRFGGSVWDSVVRVVIVGVLAGLLLAAVTLGAGASDWLTTPACCALVR
jgi:hypothetical protein